MKNVYFEKWESPLGPLFLYSNDTHLVGLTFPANNDRFLKTLRLKPQAKSSALIKRAKSQLTEYFKGRRREFDLPFVVTGTDFQKRAWAVLSGIPFGTTMTYAQQAQSINSAKAFRAVGTANGRNPISIVVPCHRVVGTDGKITGYAGGPKVKAALLRLEGLYFDD